MMLVKTASSVLLENVEVDVVGPLCEARCRGGCRRAPSLRVSRGSLCCAALPAAASDDRHGDKDRVDIPSAARGSARGRVPSRSADIAWIFRGDNDRRHPRWIFRAPRRCPGGVARGALKPLVPLPGGSVNVLLQLTTLIDRLFDGDDHSFQIGNGFFEMVRDDVTVLPHRAKLIV